MHGNVCVYVSCTYTHVRMYACMYVCMRMYVCVAATAFGPANAPQNRWGDLRIKRTQKSEVCNLDGQIAISSQQMHLSENWDIWPTSVVKLPGERNAPTKIDMAAPSVALALGGGPPWEGVLPEGGMGNTCLPRGSLLLLAHSG